MDLQHLPKDYLPIHEFAAQGNVQKVREELSEADPSLVNAPTRGVRMRPIHYAALHGHADVLEVLINEAHATRYYTNWRGETALHIATERGCSACVHVLAEDGKADLDAKEYVRNKTALDIAREKYRAYGEIVRILESQMKENM